MNEQNQIFASADNSPESGFFHRHFVEEALSEEHAPTIRRAGRHFAPSVFSAECPDDRRAFFEIRDNLPAAERRHLDERSGPISLIELKAISDSLLRQEPAMRSSKTRQQKSGISSRGSSNRLVKSVDRALHKVRNFLMQGRRPD